MMQAGSKTIPLLTRNAARAASIRNTDPFSSTSRNQEGLKLFPVIEEILSFPVSEENVTARGWIKTIRRQKKVSFVELTDGSTSRHLQVVLKPNDSEDLETGCAVQVTGNLVKSLGDRQPNELRAKEVLLIGGCSALEYPLQKNSSHGSAFLRKIPHLRLRTPQMAALLRIRSAMAREASMFLDTHHFFRTETPVITFNDCEGAGEVFSVKPEEEDPVSDVKVGQPSDLPKPSNHTDGGNNEFFGKQAFLTVSAQLHLEALAASLGRVYTLGPAFRAERSQTNRHLAEFWMLEAELSFVKDLQKLMDLVESLVKSIVKNLSQPDTSSALDLKLLGAPHHPLTCVETNWPRISYDQAVKLIDSHNQTVSSSLLSDDNNDARLPPISWGQPLASEHERWLAGTYAQGPIFVTDYPSSLKPFYMRQNQPTNHQSHDGPSSSPPRTTSTVACFDLLVPGIGELVGGSLRECDLIKLRQSMIHKGLLQDLSIPAQNHHHSPPSSQQGLDQMDHKFNWYLDLRRFGSHYNAGFGLGWERLLAWLTGASSVRECVAFPRAPGSGFC